MIWKIKTVDLSPKFFLLFYFKVYEFEREKKFNQAHDGHTVNAIFPYAFATVIVWNGDNLLGFGS